MGHAVHERLLRLVVDQAYRSAPTLQEPERLRLPPRLPIQGSAEPMAVPLHLCNSLVVQLAQAPSVSFFRTHLDRHIHITESAHFPSKIAAEQDHSGDLGQEVVVAVDAVYALQKPGQSCVGGLAGDGPGRGSGTERLRKLGRRPSFRAFAPIRPGEAGRFQCLHKTARFARTYGEYSLNRLPIPVEAVVQPAQQLANEQGGMPGDRGVGIDVHPLLSILQATATGLIREPESGKSARLL